MREVRDVRYGFDEWNGRFGTNHDREYFAFLVRRTGTKDVRVEADALVAPSYVPLEILLREAMAALAAEGVTPAPCEACRRVFDPDRDDGIFRDPARLTGFLCRPCAEKMSAWTYFQEWFRG